jgi:predicted Rossmann fold flavoprotein
MAADAVVLALGGNPKPKHYEMIRKLGHTVHDPIPSLFTFNLPGNPSNQLMGLAVEAVVFLRGTSYREEGPVLFTHWGMSGPAILKLSARAASYLHDCKYHFQFEVAWDEEVEALLNNFRREKAKQTVGASRHPHLPLRLWQYLLKRSGITLEKNWADLNRQALDSLMQVLKADVYEARGKTTFKEEFVTCGGVELSEINLKSMESKLVPDLYFTGEVMNVDALTGGFNFQAAWTTSFLAARAIAENQSVGSS